MSNNSEDINETQYNKLWKEIHNQIKATARTFVPQLYDALIQEGYLKVDARKKIKEDARPIWKPETIDEYIPQEAKQEIKVLAGQQSGIVRNSVRRQSNELDEKKPNSSFLASLKESMTTTDDSNNDNNSTREYNVTIYFAGKDITLKIIARDLIKIIPPNKYVNVAW